MTGKEFIQSLSGQKRAVMFTITGCVFCEQLYAILQEVCTERSIALEEHNSTELFFLPRNTPFWYFDQNNQQYCFIDWTIYGNDSASIKRSIEEFFNTIEAQT